MRRRQLILAAVAGAALAGCTCAEPPADRPPADGVSTSATGATASTGASGDTSAPLAWVQLDGGYLESCGVLNDGRLVCWGAPEYLAAHPKEDIVQVSIGNAASCALRGDGGVTCWCTISQQACNEAPLGSGFVRVESGDSGACAETEAHQLRCWGAPSLTRNVPEEPVAHWAIEIDVGCAVLLDGSVSCWGNKSAWELGPDDVALGPPEGLKYTQVAVGRDHACALDTTGEAHCWGSTQLQGKFPDAPPGPWASIFAWNAYACGLRADGSAECWYDLPGILDEWYLPDERWVQIGLGEWSSCGLTVDGRGLCFPTPYEHWGEQQVPDLASLAAR